MQPIDSPTGWVADHIRTYVESGGQQGHHWNGADTLLITTRGRRTGQLRRTALVYGRHGDGYVVVGSDGGKPKHPSWYLNLLADPQVTVQVGPDIFTAQAVPAGPDTRPALWTQMAAIFPTYDHYQSIAGREIPVVVLTPAG